MAVRSLTTWLFSADFCWARLVGFHLLRTRRYSWAANCGTADPTAPKFRNPFTSFSSRCDYSHPLSTSPSLRARTETHTRALLFITSKDTTATYPHFRETYNPRMIFLKRLWPGSIWFVSNILGYYVSCYTAWSTDIRKTRSQTVFKILFNINESHPNTLDVIDSCCSVKATAAL